MVSLQPTELSSVINKEHKLTPTYEPNIKKLLAFVLFSYVKRSFITLNAQGMYAEEKIAKKILDAKICVKL